MTKSILIDPAVERQRGLLTAPAVPINAYEPNFEREREHFGVDGLVRIYRDMIFIREFETMLEQIKREGQYEGIAYQHRGPAHLSIGQESAVVGMCAALDVDDLIFGSHRSHGEILARCFAAIERLPEASLTETMRTYLDGDILRVVESFSIGQTRSVATDYVLYGTLAEIFGRATGFNRGLGGSMHAFFPPFGVMPNNAIVGGSADIALGAALFKRIRRRPGIVVANIGDASMGCGPVWEAMMLASMDQYHTLWDPAIGGAPPMLFNLLNNFYGMGGQPRGETMGFGVLARVGMGVNAEAMHAERIDGYNPLAVADAFRRKKQILLEGRGPVLLDTVTYRFSGHSPSDASSYRERSEIDLWRAQDALASYRAYLLENGASTPEVLDTFAGDARSRLVRVLEAAVLLDQSPRLVTEDDGIGRLMFSGQQRPALAEDTPETRLPLEETRLAQTHAKARFGIVDGVTLSGTKAVTFADALFEAMIEGFYRDPTMVAYGEENRDWGGAFGVYRGLTEALPHHRLFNTPISEGAIVGSAVGYALSGGRVVAELMYCDFVGRAGDEIFNQMAKWQAMSGGVLKMPLVLRVSVGSKYGAQHSQDWSSLVAHIPGLKVYFPATPYDAKGMLTTALLGTDPVVFFESQRLYSEPETLVTGGVPIGSFSVPEGQPVVRRTGSDLTLITLGAALYRALEAARMLQEQHHLSAEVIDARFLNPLDYDLLMASVRKTGRALLVSDACERGSFLHTMASTLQTQCFDALDAPVVVLGARNWITPAAEMEETFFPQPEWILDAIHEQILPLPGHRVQTNQTRAERLRQARSGV
jgi:2-oxoisovalerate dehydrogenase E1 component